MDLGIASLEGIKKPDTVIIFGEEPNELEALSMEANAATLAINIIAACKLLRTVGATEEVLALIDASGELRNIPTIDITSPEKAGKQLADLLEQNLTIDTEGIFNKIGGFFEKVGDSAYIKSWEVDIDELLEKTNKLLKGETYNNIKNIDQKKLDDINMSGMSFDAYMPRVCGAVSAVALAVKQAETGKPDMAALVRAWKTGGYVLDIENAKLYSITTGDYTYIRGTTAKKLGLTGARMIELLTMLKAQLTQGIAILDKIHKLRNDKRNMFEASKLSKEEKAKLKQQTAALKCSILAGFGIILRAAKNITGLASALEDKIRKN